MKRILSHIVLAALLMSVILTGGCAARDEADAGNGVICFDAASAGWENANDIVLLITDLNTNEPAVKTLAGTKGDSSVVTFDTAAAGMQKGHEYSIVFYHADTNDETYPLLMNTVCFGDTAYATGGMIEKPSDSFKACYEVRWKSGRLGPILQITSIGNVVGETIPENTSAYQMLVDFLASKDTVGLTRALEYSGTDAQTTIDAVASTLGLTKDVVAKAIEEAGTAGSSVTGEKTDWSGEWDIREFSTVPEGSDKNGTP